MNKYYAKRTEYNGEVYDSKREAQRAAELDLLLKAGKITGLRRQVKFELVPSQKDPKTGKLDRGVSYIADFVYFDGDTPIIEDVKGYRTGEYKIKRKLVRQLLGVWISEV